MLWYIKYEAKKTIVVYHEVTTMIIKFLIVNTIME